MKVKFYVFNIDFVILASDNSILRKSDGYAFKSILTGSVCSNDFSFQTCSNIADPHCLVKFDMSALKTFLI